MATRRTNKRTRPKRGRFGFLYKLVSFLLILVVIVAGCVVFFRVNEITVAGQSQYTAQEIITASGIENGDNLFALNKYEAARRILSTLPYVDEVTIQRILPDGLMLSVSECRPALLVEGGNVWWVVDSKGKILQETKTSSQEGMARVTGIKAVLPTAGTMLAVDLAEEAKLQTLLELIGTLEERGMSDKVSDIDLTSTARLTFTYDGRFSVVLPMSADFSRAARALQITVDEKLQSNDSGKIDMTRMAKDKEVIFSPD